MCWGNVREGGHMGEGRVFGNDRSWGLRILGMEGLLCRID